MKTDSYTKVVLTIIALCLIIIVFKEIDFISSANANTSSAISNKNISYGIVPLNADGSVNVNIESCDSYAFQYAGPMKVIIKENDDK